MTARTERVAVAALAVLYLASAVGFALTTPYGEPPDEPGHLSYIDYVHRFHALPEIKPYPYTFDAFQPPLYYAVGSAMVIISHVLTGAPSRDEPIAPGVKTRPGAQVGVGGHFARFRDPEGRRWLLWPMLLRIPSILMGLGVVLLTYATARVIVPAPAPPVVPLIAAAFSALIPGFNHIRASISNSNLTDLMCAWVVWLLVLHLMQPHQQRRVVWLGVALGLGLLTKASAALLFLPVLWVLWIRRESMQSLVRDLVRMAVPVLVLAGPFYIYRTVAYGDPLAWGALHRMLQPDSQFQLLDLFWFQEPFRMMLWTSFWGVYGHQVLWMPNWIYNLFTAVTLLAVGGGVYLLVRRALNRAQAECCAVLLSVLLLMYGLVIQASTYLIAWQGRELYPAMSSVCVLFGLGLGGLVLGPAAVRPEPLDRRRRVVALGLVGVVVVGLVVLNVYVIGWLMAPGMTAG